MKVVLGWLVNLLAVAAAASAGAWLRGRIRARYQELILVSCGLVAGVIGLWEACSSLLLFTAEGKDIEIPGTALILVALVAGTGLGHALDMEHILDKLSHCFIGLNPGKKAAHSTAQRSVVHTQPTDDMSPLRTVRELPVYNLPSARSGHRFADGFAIATLFLCVDPLMLSAAAHAGATGEVSALFYTAILHAVIAAALAFVYGWGVAFAAVPFGLLQGVMLGVGKLQSRLAVRYAESVVDLTDQVKNYSGEAAEKALLQATLDNATLKSTFWSTTAETILTQMCVIGGIILIALALDLACGKRFKVAHMLPALLIPLVYYGAVLLVKLA